MVDCDSWLDVRYPQNHYFFRMFTGCRLDELLCLVDLSLKPEYLPKYFVFFLQNVKEWSKGNENFYIV